MGGTNADSQFIKEISTKIIRMKEKIKAIEFFSGSLMEAEFVKSLLENAEIVAFLQDEYAGTLIPWQTSAGGANHVRIIISSEYLEKAKQVLTAYYKSK